MNEMLIVPTFTVEEENFICIFDTTSRAALIEGISGAIPGLIEPLADYLEVADIEEISEMAEIAQSALRKLQAMTDEDFAELTFHPAYHGEVEDDEYYDEDDVGGFGGIGGFNSIDGIDNTANNSDMILIEVINNTNNPH